MAKENSNNNFKIVIIAILTFMFIALMGIGVYIYSTGNDDFVSTNYEDLTTETDVDISALDEFDNPIQTDLTDTSEPIQDEGYVPVPLISGTINVPLSQFDVKTQGYLYVYNNMNGIPMTLKINGVEQTMPYSSVVDQGSYIIEVTTSNPYYESYTETVTIAPLTLKQRGIILNLIPQVESDDGASSSGTGDVNDDAVDYDDYDDYDIEDINDEYGESESTPTTPTPSLPDDEPTQTYGDIYISVGGHYNAVIYFDGVLKATGKNIQINDIPTGTHTVKWTDSGYQDYTKTVTIVANKKIDAYPVWTSSAVPTSDTMPSDFKFVGIYAETTYDDKSGQDYRVQNAKVTYATSGSNLWYGGKLVGSVTDYTNSYGRTTKKIYADPSTKITVTVSHGDVLSRTETMYASGSYKQFYVLPKINYINLKCTHNLISSDTNKQNYVPYVNDYYVYTKNRADFIKEASLLLGSYYNSGTSAVIYYSTTPAYDERFRDSYRWIYVDTIPAGTSSKILSNSIPISADNLNDGKFIILVRYKGETKSNMDVYQYTVTPSSDKKTLSISKRLIDYIPESEASKMSFTTSFY